MYPFGKGAARIMPYLLLSIPVLLYLLLGFGPSMVTVLFPLQMLPGFRGRRGILSDSRITRPFSPPPILEIASLPLAVPYTLP